VKAVEEVKVVKNLWVFENQLVFFTTSTLSTIFMSSN